eukprot:3677923-Lingulodinium_polyedra.AAC.1
MPICSPFWLSAGFWQSISAAMNGRTLQDKVIEFARPSKVLDKADVRELHKMTVLGSDFLVHKAKGLIIQANNAPILCSFGADGTTLLSRRNFSYEVGEQRKVRSGGTAVEYLVQKAFLKTVDYTPGPQQCALLKPP